MQRIATKRKTTGKEASSRKFSFLYCLSVENCQASSVCKKFFLDTLGIKEDVVYGACKKKCSGGVVTSDQRGRHMKQRRVADSIKRGIRQHIESFTPVESHYCRKQTDRKYLPESLSLRKMYRLYQDSCKEQGTTPAMESTYRKIFNREFNYYFFTPKKDQCDFCTQYRNTSSKSEDLERAYQVHCAEKEMARQCKENAKMRAKSEPEIIAACFDLQQVLNCPHGEISSFYYHRKLSVYNLTVYNMGNGFGSCYLWSEVIACRGANEVASCLFRFITEHASQGGKIFELFSDNCGGQNRNRFVATLYWFLVGSIDAIESVTHSFLEVGHTQNENDSIHSAIERAARKAKIYTPEQWSAVARTARQNKPYSVQDMQLVDFINFKEVAKEIRNFDVTDAGCKVNWSKLRSIRFSKAEPNIMLVKHSHGDDYARVDLMRRKRNVTSAADVQLPQLRTTGLHLSAAKYKDLSVLCAKNLIPPPYHPFFQALPHDDTA